MCSKDCKKYGIAAGTSVVLVTAMEFVVHHLILSPTYQKPEFASIWNTPETMNSRMPAMLLAHALFGLVFAWIYTKGYEEAKPPLPQGLRYGLMAGLLTGVHSALINYFVYPVSCGLACSWAAAAVVECLILGAVVSFIYRPHSH
ncbi:MAG: hypothetical protein HYT79_06780 [Elusimicrobia bacterium]|nr:hypothetical protein [Elusimicrobiota bacterium]